MAQTTAEFTPNRMRVALLHKIDRWFGVPLCFLLTLIRKFAGLFGSPNMPPVRKLLMVKLAEQGSTVLAYPAIRQAVEWVGRDNVYFIAFEDNRFILDALDLIPRENVITISLKNFGAFATSGWAAVLRLRRLKLDAAVDMEFFARGSAVIAFLSGATSRAGFHTFYDEGPYRGDLMTHRLLYNPHLHTSQTFQTLVLALKEDPAALPTFGLHAPTADLPLPQFLPAPGEREEVAAMVRELTGRKDSPPLLLLNPNASDLLPLRKWPLDRYAELAGRLLDRFPEICVAFTGSAEEASASAQLVRQVGSPRCVSLAGRTTLRQLLVLYTLAEVVVTNDSGPAHFAALTPIHVVTLFGPETPALYASRTPRSLALWAGIVCSPCVSALNNRQSPCRNNICMQIIGVEQVFAAVCGAYERRHFLDKNQP
jgi:ADP-heptose:LPS heptosyltransferase